MRKTGFLILVASCLLCSAAAAGTNDTAIRSVLQRDLDGYLSARSSIEHISALSLSVDLPGQATINVVSGRTSLGGATPVTPSNLYDIGSNTKAFIACVLLQLEAEGKLNIDQTVGRWLPQYPAWSLISIRQLLNMTSGIPTYDNNPAMERAQATSIHRRWTDPVLVAFEDPVYGAAAAAKPGQYLYSNTGYLLAGMIIERVTGRSYVDEVESRLIRPLGLSNTFISANVYPSSVTDRLVSGYFFNDDPDNELLKPLYGSDVRLMDLSWASAAGSMVATPEDLAHWARAMYTGKVLAPKQQQELESIVSTKTGKPISGVSPSDPRGFGLGVVQIVRPDIGTCWFYQGETLGYRMIHLWLPMSNSVIALGINGRPSAKKAEYEGTLLVKIYDDLVKNGVMSPNR